MQNICQIKNIRNRLWRIILILIGYIEFLSLSRRLKFNNLSESEQIRFDKLHLCDLRLCINDSKVKSNRFSPFGGSADHKPLI